MVAGNPETRLLLGVATRSLERQLGEPLEFVEAADGEAGVRLARWSGADAWFVKPVDAFEMADTILELVRASRGMDVLAERGGAG